MIFTVKRVHGGSYGTFGVLARNNVPFAVTLENPWLYNEPNVSCIPEGYYVCKRVMSPKFGDTFEVTDVRRRSHILFHKGNTDDDTEGCILVAENFGELNGTPSVLSSNQGFNEFKELTKDLNEFDLEITNYW